ncbi:heavy-metal-associated domain-containing protein [Flavobacterium cellulosilyticum]|uniref:Copper chaperone n=1 Tax=Flavobacterium cellulosilyticum TaxID=2541731 RepID=A0A4R5CAW5_9FLAO|nr:heavy-metal-associated domain-containing protein [Flavobacterium cellulosilyticum]TDD97078.1 copper chaperone [Flavobacterium cellulosilyticum]
MKSLLKIMVAITLLLSNVDLSAQIKNTKAETVKIYGNCGMCKKAIEKSANIKGIATVDWNKDTKMAILTYDSTKTNQSEILKKIALAGYDSEKIKAKKEDYDNLPGCCQYDREK